MKNTNDIPIDQDIRFDHLVKAVSDEVKKKFKDKKLPSLKDQLKNLLKNNPSC